MTDLHRMPRRLRKRYDLEAAQAAQDARDRGDAEAIEPRIVTHGEWLEAVSPIIRDFTPHGRNGCTCSCHRDSGIVHCVPCC